jgi:hypothetical protein
LILLLVSLLKAYKGNLINRAIFCGWFIAGVIRIKKNEMMLAFFDFNKIDMGAM